MTDATLVSNLQETFRSSALAIQLKACQLFQSHYFRHPALEPALALIEKHYPVVHDKAVTYYRTYQPVILEKAASVSNSEHVLIIKDVLLICVLVHYISAVFSYIWKNGPIGCLKIFYQTLATKFFKFFLSLPFISGSVDAKVDKVLGEVESLLIDRSSNITYYPELPEHGWSTEQVIAELNKASEMKHADWEHGRLSGAVYHGGTELTDLQTEAFKRFTITNQLHPDAFPALRKMDAEVVSMVLNLFHAPETGSGTSTSGGTESLLLTCLSAREKAFHERGVTEPEIVAPVTIHAAFDKAAYYFKMKLVHAPLDPVTMQVDLKAVKKLVNKNTVLIAGSAPNFPHGIIDDIEGLSKIALKKKIPLHVDCCLGSFVVPFLKEGGVENPPLFDFRVPGVTSISCDTHKYAFAPKGSSIIMYRTPELRRYQYFVSTSWSGGLYASPTLAGSRPGALMVGAWATLMKEGRDGYVKHSSAILRTARRIKEFVQNEMPELYVLGDPVASVVSFSSKTLNVYDLSDAMGKRGWHLNTLQNPTSLHIACTVLTAPIVEEFCKDLKETTRELVQSGSKSSSDGTAALYGVAGSISTAGVAERIASGFVDCLYKL